MDQTHYAEIIDAKNDQIEQLKQMLAQRDADVARLERANAEQGIRILELEERADPQR